VLAYGSETWVLSKSDEARLGVFERKVLRPFFGPINDNGEWRIKYSDELYTLYKDCDIITYIKINRLRWAGRVIRLEEQNLARRVFAAVVERRRQKGRPKLRWEDGVTADAKKLGEKHWRSTARNRRMAEASEEGLGSKWAVVPMIVVVGDKSVKKVMLMKHY
jgi:hypothetical protein